MEKKEYSFAAGTVMIAASILFFILPAIITNMDAFIPVVLAIISMVTGIFFFTTGLNK